MAIKLIGFHGSTCTLRVLITLYELGLPYELEVPVFADIKKPEYLTTKHPFGRVPVLIDDKFQIYESRAICRYLISKYQGTKNSTILIPSDVEKSALVNQFLSVEHSYYDKAVNKVMFELIIKKFQGGTTDPETVKEGREEINSVLDVYEKLLEGKNYLNGEFSIADLSHLPVTFYLHRVGNGDLWEDPKRPNVSRWWKSISERECWKKLTSDYKEKFFA